MCEIGVRWIGKTGVTLYAPGYLAELPTLCKGQDADLKMEVLNYGHLDGVRWWLSRMGREDGETNRVHIEQLIDGRWELVHMYGEV
jgi:hypothetical protein